MIFIINYFKTFSQPRFFRGCWGSFFVIHDVNRQLAKHHKYSRAVFGFAYPKHKADSKILAKRIRNFAEVFCWGYCRL